jgi:hypothetical protein
MRHKELSFLAIVALVVFAASTTALPAGAQCPQTNVIFEWPDFFAPPAAPIPYNPALPEFVGFLNANLGIPTVNMKTFDDLTSNRHFVATLRHGLRHCFPGSSLKLFMRARAHSDVPTNDSVTIYNTDFGVWSFPVIYASSIQGVLIPSWTNSTTAILSIDLTAQMNGNMIGDMLQIRIQDDSAVDFIGMSYTP